MPISSDEIWNINKIKTVEKKIEKKLLNVFGIFRISIYNWAFNAIDVKSKNFKFTLNNRRSIFNISLNPPHQLLAYINFNNKIETAVLYKQ